MKRLLKRCWAVLMSLALLLSCCASAEEAPLALDEDEMFDYMVDEFEGIAQIPRGSGTVSYTHLDVYKRQCQRRDDLWKAKEGSACSSRRP